MPSCGLLSSQQHSCSSSTSSTLFIRFLVVVTASVIHDILARAWSGCLSAAAVSLMFQGVEMTIGAVSDPLPREGPNAQDRAERLMAPPPGGRDCSPSVEKHVNIVLAIRGLREPEHSRQRRAFCVEQLTDSYSGPDRGRIHSPVSGGIP